MVRDGYYYGFSLILAAVLVGWLTSAPWGLIPLALAAFFLWFFRDPERSIPEEAGLVVSPADGKVTDISTLEDAGTRRTRISIFLSVFNVHVNRAPIGGRISNVRYQGGEYLNAMNPASAEQNEQNIVAVEGEEHTVVFKQIAGLLARRIVFTKNIGDAVVRGERVGLIKFGSRVDVLMEAESEIQVKVGDHVKGGATILARLPVRELAASSPGNNSDRQQNQGAR